MHLKGGLEIQPKGGEAMYYVREFLYTLSFVAVAYVTVSTYVKQRLKDKSERRSPRKAERRSKK